MVCSAPANIEARNAIRRSWGSETRIAGYRISIYFILGRTNNATVQVRRQVLLYRFSEAQKSIALKIILVNRILRTALSISTFAFKKNRDSETFFSV